MVDLSFLENFTKGNTAKMHRYISMYLSAAPETFERMDQNIQDKSWHELAINAHSLKPQAEFMGIASLKESLIEIETKVKNDQIEGMQSLFTSAKRIHEEAEVLLKDFLNNG